MNEVMQRIEGVVIGIFLGFDGEHPLVVFPGNPREEALRARSLAELNPAMIGAEVALLFEGGDLLRPLIVGRIIEPARRHQPPVEILRDDERVEITGEELVEIRCGEASIVLEKNGRITIRGTQVTSQASGTNWIRGGAVNLN